MEGGFSMAEAVSFWLDNKMSSGVKVAEIGGQTLVSYRDKFYIVEKGAALMKGSRPLHYSKSSIPTIWRKVMRGVPVAAAEPQNEENMPMATTTKRERSKVKKETADGTGLKEQPQISHEVVEAAELKTAAPQITAVRPKPARPVRKNAPGPAQQTVVVTVCPYCSHRHDIPLEKGKGGKAFLMSCARCGLEFAVRFVPVTVYQAQVAAFA
jgi:hypothetical protein